MKNHHDETLYLAIWEGESDTAYKVGYSKSALIEEAKIEAREITSEAVVLKETEEQSGSNERWTLHVYYADTSNSGGRPVALSTFLVIRVPFFCGFGQGWMQRTEF